MTLTELKKAIRHNPNGANYISGYQSWQSEIATRKEMFGDSKVTERNQEEVTEWNKLNDLCRKSLREQAALKQIKEEFK